LGKWQNLLRFDPLPHLLSSENQAIVFFTKRDLQNEKVNHVEALWELPSAQKIVGNQQPDGSWKYHGGKPDIRSQQNYNQFETYLFQRGARAICIQTQDRHVLITSPSHVLIGWFSATLRALMSSFPFAHY